MTKKMFEIIKNYMIECMRDSAHDSEHIFRVLYTAIHIANEINTSDAYNAFISLGYSVDGGIRNATSITNETSNGGTIHNYTTPAYIKSTLDQNRPIFICGDNAAGSTGHVWIIDGYGSMQWYKEYVHNTQTGEEGYVTVTLSSNGLMVHCNLGWDGKADGWYIYGIFDTKNQSLLSSRSSKNDKDYSFGTKIIVPYR